MLSAILKQIRACSAGGLPMLSQCTLCKVYLWAGAKEVNMLDLGPYHFKLKAHIQKLIDDLSLAIGPKMSYSAATLDGEPWHYQPFSHPVQIYLTSRSSLWHS